MFNLSIGVGELILRAAAVYVVLFTLLRIGGKKHVGDLSPFDLVVLLILSETLQGALIADDNSLIGGLLSAATLLAIVHAVGYVSWRYKKVERILEGTPRVLVRHGHVYRDVMSEERVRHAFGADRGDAARRVCHAHQCPLRDARERRYDHGRSQERQGVSRVLQMPLAPVRFHAGA